MTSQFPFPCTHCTIVEAEKIKESHLGNLRYIDQIQRFYSTKDAPKWKTIPKNPTIVQHPQYGWS
jgi:hypothetical protein